MLEKPDLHDDKISAVLQDAYGIKSEQLEFLPLGADLNTAVYRAVATDMTPYFVKLRRGDFNEMTVIIPRFLHAEGVPHLIAPLSTRTDTLWTEVEAYKVMVYPFVEGKDGYDAPLTGAQWRDMANAFKQIHTTPIPSDMELRLTRERYASVWREKVKTYLARTDENTVDDPIVLDLFGFLAENRADLFQIVERAEQLAHEIQSFSPEYVLCHADIHAGNVLIQADGTFYIVDWDTMVMAPKERDLMYFGAGLWGKWQSAEEEERLFFQGYGEANIDAVILAYYRYERIVEDIAVSCDHILQTDASNEERALSLYYLKSNFRPNSTIAQARRADPMQQQ